MISPAIPTSTSSLPPSRRLSRRLKLALVAFALAFLGGLLFLVDLPIALWCKAATFPETVLWFLEFSERVANGKDVSMILLGLLFLDPALRAAFTLRPGSVPPRDRWAFPQMVAATFGGGFVVQAIKSVVPRVRPRVADLTDLTSAFATFGDSAIANPPASRYDLAGFPSGHATVAAGLAAALAWRYPHATPLFCLLAVSAAVQRVVSSAHYPSDIAFGAAVGLLVAALVLPRDS